MHVSVGFEGQKMRDRWSGDPPKEDKRFYSFHFISFHFISFITIYSQWIEGGHNDTIIIIIYAKNVQHIHMMC